LATTEERMMIEPTVPDPITSGPWHGVVGNGGVGSAIAAAVTGLGLAGIGLFDPHAPSSRRR
jgi:hypothetical protein